MFIKCINTRLLFLCIKIWKESCQWLDLFRLLLMILFMAIIPEGAETYTSSAAELENANWQ